MTPPSATDQAARDRIANDLDTSLLVEAGAGAGKTTCLVQRMVNLVRRGEPVERIAAVTFTRKAANELRERFQLGLEAALRDEWDPTTRSHLDQALRQLDSSFLGTIHAFCGRLLRERAFEAGLDPTFEEVDQDQFALLRDGFFDRYLERVRLAGDSGLAELNALGIDARALSTAFATLVENADVAFPLIEAPRPDHTRCRKRLETLLHDAGKLMPAEEPDGGWDALMTTIRRLLYLRRVTDFDDLATFCDAIGTMSASGCEPVQKRWADDKEGKRVAKELGLAFAAFLIEEAEPLLAEWRTHRYPPVIRFLQRAAAAFADERNQHGRLGFQDLLSGAARLLRESPSARSALGERYRWLLVDEFQDTDPIQAEVLLLLTSEPGQGRDWRAAVPRPGSLFVVGDPKQSIFRFRRADLETYGFVRERLRACGAVLGLTQNFRSTRPVERLVNAFANQVFPTEATAEQAPFAPMQTVKSVLPADGVFHYPVPQARNGAQVLAADAAQLASWVAARIESKEREPGDFLILVYHTWWVEAYARALAERNIAVTTTGARLPQERELRELRLLLEALGDPANSVLIAAVLEGLFFGLSHATLYEARQRDIAFSALAAPAGDGAVAEALQQIHRWQADAHALPADLLLERLLDETGLLPYAASQPLGDGRAATLLHLLETVRGAATAGASGIAGALEVIDAALAASLSTTLRPGVGDVVRVMNLHHAKGLESPVVVLAAPLEPTRHDPEFHVRRTEEGAVGWLAVVDGQDGLIAHPPGWSEMQADEARFLAAEADRLRYVAATRAERELVVARMIKQNTRTGAPSEVSAWAPLSAALEQHGTELALDATEAPGRRQLDRSFEAVSAEVEAARARLRQAAAPTFEVRPSVSRDVKTERYERVWYDLTDAPRARGRDWGTAVHRAIEAMGRGRSGEALRRFLHAVARDENLAEDPAGITESVARLEELLKRVRGLPEWQARVGLEVGVMRVAAHDGVAEVEEGVVDLLTRSGDGYQVLDWKTDRAGDAVWEERLPQYQAQVAKYADMLRSLGHRLQEARLERLV